MCSAGDLKLWRLLPTRQQQQFFVDLLAGVIRSRPELDRTALAQIAGDMEDRRRLLPAWIRFVVI
jgi:hypothetical protein